MNKPTKLQPLKQTSISKLVAGGYGLGHDHEGKVTMILNALPGEEVEFFITKNKKTHFQGIAENIITASPHRLDALEPDHFLSCSPWQILNWEQENYWKQQIAQEAFHKINNLPAQITIAHTKEPQLQYRNKMEYSFTTNDDGELALAFFKRGSKRKVAINGCILAEAIINQIAAPIVSWLNQQDIIEDQVKSLIIRSDGQGQGIAALFLRTEISFDQYPQLPEACLGLQIYYSNPQSPASVPTKLLYQQGQDYLIAELNGTKLKFGLHSFFQVNIPLFAEALDDIASHLPTDRPIIDYYSGVGAIGLPLCGNFPSCELVDSNEEAIAYAKDNIQLNKIGNAQAHCLPAEKITELITPDKTIIVDPPRAGLHPKMVKKILEAKPSRIVYLSCDLNTQARDLDLLQAEYNLTFIKLYNFFPRTPHVEALAVLEKI